MALGTPYTVVSDSVAISTGTTRQATITANVAAGDALVVSCWDNQTAITGVTDSAGNTYALAQSQAGNSLHSYQFVALNCAAMTSGSDWIKLTFGNITSASQVGMIVRGCSGVAT